MLVNTRVRGLFLAVLAGTSLYLCAAAPAGAAAVRAAEPPAGAAPRKRINVLLLMDDQHRGDFLGAAGATWLRTPHLDRLAAEGALFTRAYTSVPSCLPARAGLLTGQSPWRHGLLGYATIPPHYEHEMPRMFAEAGYRTHAVGKNHFRGNDTHGYQTTMLEEAWKAARFGGKPDSPQRQNALCDYRKWFEANYPDKDVDATGLSYTDHRGGRPWPYDDALHATNWTADRAVEFLENHDGAKPWFLKVSFKRPHPPFDPPRRWVDPYENVDFPMPRVGAWAEEWHGRAGGTLETRPSATRGRFPDDEVRRSRQYYVATISHVDEQIGKVLAALKKRGELENTIILFCSDHGDMMGDQHLWRKCYAYEPSARVPMIVRWPEALGVDADRGQVIDKLVELRDVLPTFLDAAGIDQPGAMDGMSVLDLVRGETDGWREVLDLEHCQIYWPGNSWVALTDARYKYIYFTTTGQQQLFDLKNDPHELNDLAADGQQADLLRAWRRRMVAFLAERGEHWVKDGDLAIQTRVMMHSPHFPGNRGR